MSRHPWIVLLVITLLGHAAWVLAQEVSITSPASGATVRGLVKIQGVKPDPESGWMSFKLEGPGQKDEFIAAVIKPYVWVWDTTAREQDKRVFPDGMYTIRAVAQSPAGAVIGETSVRVTVANNLGPGEAPSSVRLKVSYTRGHEYKYDVDGTRVVSPKEPNPFLQALADQFTGVLQALYVDTTLTTSSGGPALLRKRLVEGWTRWGREKPKNVSGVGKSFIQVLTAEGRVEVKRTGDPLLELGSLSLELPDRPLRVGDTWSSDLWLLLDPADDKRHQVRAQHKLDGFQWYSGIKTARIVSKFEAKDVDLLVPGQGSSWRVVTDYEGTRYSYFAYEAGRFVGIEDEINHEYEAYMAQATGGMSMGMPGMEAGMPGMPGMEPGMPGMPEVPGMMPAGPGGMPGMMPGGPGGGMPGMMPGGPGGMPGMMPGGPGGGMPGMMPGGPGGGMPGMMPGGPGGMPGMMPSGPGGGMPGMMPGGPGGMPGMMPGGPGGGMPGMMPGATGGMGVGSTMPAKIEAKGTVTIKVTEVN